MNILYFNCLICIWNCVSVLCFWFDIRFISFRGYVANLFQCFNWTSHRTEFYYCQRISNSFGFLIFLVFCYVYREFHVRIREKEELKNQRRKNWLSTNKSVKHRQNSRNTENKKRKLAHIGVKEWERIHQMPESQNVVQWTSTQWLWHMN